MTDKTPATKAGRRLLAYVTGEVTLAEHSQPAWPGQWAADILAIEAEARDSYIVAMTHTSVYQQGRADALHDISRQIRALPTTFGPGIPVNESALEEREAIASFIDEVAG